MKHSIPVSILISALLLAAINTLYAQRGGFGRGPGFGSGPMTLGIQYDYFDPSAFHQILGTFSQTMPLGFRRGEAGVPSLNRMSFLNLAGGVRFGGERDSTEFRWHAGLLEGDINHGFLLIGATILDYDKSGILEKDFRWFNLRLGLSKGVGSRKILVIPEILASVGAGSWELGKANYQYLGSIVDSFLSGVEAGYRAGLSLALARKLTLYAGYSERVLVDNLEPHFKTWNAEARVLFGKIEGAVIDLFARYSEEKTELRDTGILQENKNIKAGFRITLIPKRPRENPWD
jgi:hypothetical protein